jgi:hypothetical protein
MDTFWYQQKEEKSCAQWLETVHHVPFHWFSVTPAADRLIQNWLPIMSYIRSVNDCPKELKKKVQG